MGSYEEGIIKSHVTSWAAQQARLAIQSRAANDSLDAVVSWATNNNCGYYDNEVYQNDKTNNYPSSNSSNSSSSSSSSSPISFAMDFSDMTFSLPVLGGMASGTVSYHISVSNLDLETALEGGFNVNTSITGGSGLWSKDGFSVGGGYNRDDFWYGQFGYQNSGFYANGYANSAGGYGLNVGYTQSWNSGYLDLGYHAGNGSPNYLGISFAFNLGNN